MTKYLPGQDVIIEFDGVEHRAEVLEHRPAGVIVLMETDPLTDYGNVTPMMSPQQTVCVRESKVRLADETPPVIE